MTEPKPPAPGVRVASRYRLELRQTGWGAGDVWRAVDLETTRRRVCLKFLAAGDDGDEEEAERFQDYVRALTRFRHPNVLPVTDGGTHLGQFFLVTDFHAGDSLRTQMDRAASKRAPAPDAAWKILEHVGAGVRAGHQADSPRALVHGALSAECVRVGSDGEVLVTDFGLWSFCQDASLRRAAAPEQKGGDATPATDVFALGLLLVELLVPGARSRPEFAALVRGITPARADEGRALLRELRGDVYASVWGTVARALQRMPEMRHSDAGRLLEALGAARWEARPEGVADDEPVADAPSVRPGPVAGAESAAAIPGEGPNQASSPGTVANSSGTVANSSGTVANSPGTVANSSGTVANSPGTVANSSGTVANSPGTVANSSGTVANSPGTVANSSGTVANSSGTVANSSGTAAIGPMVAATPTPFASEPTAPEAEPLRSGEFTEEILAPPPSPTEVLITERPPPPDAPRSAPPMPPAAGVPWTGDDTTIEAHAPPPDPSLRETDDEPPPRVDSGFERMEVTHVGVEIPPPDHRYSETHIGPIPRPPPEAHVAHEGHHGEEVDGQIVMEPLAYLRWCLAHPAVESERPRRLARFYALVNDHDRWLEASRALLELAGRISGAGERETEFELWSRLGEIYHGPLHDPSAAADALRVALRLRPDDSATVRTLRELQRAAREVDARANELRAEISRAPSDPAPLLALCETYERAGAADRAFCAASGATLLLGASAPESVRAVFRRLRPKRLMFPRTALDRGQFSDLLLHPDANRDVNALFTALLPALVAILARPLEDVIAPGDERCDPASGATPPVRALDLAARLYDLAEPPLIIARDAQQEGLLHLGTEPPAVALGSPMLRGVTSAELRFLAARHLIDALPEFHARALCRARDAELAAFAFAAIGIASPGAEAWAPSPRALVARDALAAYFSHAPAQWPAVERAARALLAAPAPPDLARWSLAVDLTGYRAGLLLAGDLPSCARVLSVPGMPPEVLRDLLAYSVSDAHFKLRDELGLGVGS